MLETARQRLAGLKSITPAPDFGAALSLAGYQSDINALSSRLDGYNEQLSALDRLQNELDTAESALREKNTRILPLDACLRLWFRQYLERSYRMHFPRGRAPFARRSLRG